MTTGLKVSTGLYRSLKRTISPKYVRRFKTMNNIKVPLKVSLHLFKKHLPISGWFFRELKWFFTHKWAAINHFSPFKLFIEFNLNSLFSSIIIVVGVVVFNTFQMLQCSYFSVKMRGILCVASDDLHLLIKPQSNLSKNIKGITDKGQWGVAQALVCVVLAWINRRVNEMPEVYYDLFHSCFWCVPSDVGPSAFISFGNGHHALRVPLVRQKPTQMSELCWFL